jgi:hypothetical protein
MGSYKGRFRPKNPQKYKGDPTKIIYRSSWEMKVFRWCDEHPDVIEWQSEEVAIPYRNPAKGGKISRYFPDLIIKKSTGERIMIEIKPKKQTAAPNPENKFKTPTGRVSRRYIKESVTYAINRAKWEAATEYCRDRGLSFVILTEEHIKPLGK